MIRQTYDIAILGGGIIGLSLGVKLQESGLRTCLCDQTGRANTSTQKALPQNASGVAAGMIAPISEILCDPKMEAHQDLLQQAAGLWPDFAKAHGIILQHQGSLWLGDEPWVEKALGLFAEEITPFSLQQARCLYPDLCSPLSEADFSKTGQSFHLIAGESALETSKALIRLTQAYQGLGGCYITAKADLTDDGLHMQDLEISAAQTLIATGYHSQAFKSLIPELATLRPIKGQIIHIKQPKIPFSGPIVRKGATYLVPQSEGSVKLGASMEHDREDLIARFCH